MNRPEKNDLIFQAHPIFSAHKTGLISTNQVEKLNSKGSWDEVILAIHISGIFILTKRSFSKHYQVSELIPFVDLQSLVLTENNLTFTSAKTSFTIRNKKYIQIASNVNDIHTVLLDHPEIPYTLQVDEQLRDLFDAQASSFDSKYVLADRFIACVLRLPNQINEQVLKDTYHFLTEIENKITITAEHVSNPFIVPLCAAVSYDHNITHLVLKNMSMSYFHRYLAIILKNTQSINYVRIKNVSFSDPTKNLERLFIGGENGIKASVFDFRNCNFCTLDVSQQKTHPAQEFFESFSSFRGTVRKLSFSSCRFDTLSLDSLFQSLFFSNCFHSLEFLKLAGVDRPEEITLLIIQLCCCGWVLEKHCLRTLAVVNCGLDISKLLPQLLKFDTGISDLDLSENSLEKKLPSKIILNVGRLIMRKCKTNPSAIVSLFEALTRPEQPRLVTLDLKGLDITEEALTESLERISKLKCAWLAGLNLSDIALNVEQIELVVRFVRGQTSLRELCISRCISKSDSDIENVIEMLTSLARSKPFEVFRMSAARLGGIGPEIGPLVSALVRNGVIRIISIGGQEFGDDVLWDIIRTHPGTLQELYFDGYAPSSAEVLMSQCQALCEMDGLRKASWPAADVKPSISKCPSATRREMSRRVQLMRQSYVNHFGLTDAAAADSAAGPDLFANAVEEDTHAVAAANEKVAMFESGFSTSFARQSDSCPPKYDLSSQRMLDSKFRKRISISESVRSSVFTAYDDDTLDLLDECADVVGVDPINATLDDIDDNTQIDLLLSAIRTLSAEAA